MSANTLATSGKVHAVTVIPVSSTPCHLLREDPELAEVVAPDRREQAVQECVAPAVSIPPGSWAAQGSSGLDGSFGLFILDGLLIRRVGVEGRFGAELLGEGDVLRPWQEEHDSPVLALTTGWSVVSAARIAVLGEKFLEHLSNYPQLAGCLLARAIRRARNLAINMAIVQQARVDVRLHMLFWHFAARWGRVRGDGTVLPLRLTHAVLSDLVAARRPTVTSALSDLARRGLVSSAGNSWLLYGEPPGELLDVAPFAAEQVYSRGLQRSLAED